jgi:hypothetical protein
MTVVKWVFTDPVDASTYTFAINPIGGGSPQLAKQITQKSSSAPDGQVTIMEGRDNPRTLEFNGTILDQSQYEAMIEWFGKRHVITITDDLGRTEHIYITDFSPTRKWSRSYPWRHEYSVKAAIVT